MSHTRLQRFYLYALAITLVLAVSINIADARRKESIKLFFVHRTTGDLAVQRSRVPRASSLNERIRWILRELIAGPTDSRYERTLDPRVEVKEVVVQGGIVYISLGWDFVESLYRDPTLAFQSIVRSVKQNTRGLADVRILVEGTEPVSAFFGVSGGPKPKRSPAGGSSRNY